MYCISLSTIKQYRLAKLISYKITLLTETPLLQKNEAQNLFLVANYYKSAMPSSTFPSLLILTPTSHYWWIAKTLGKGN